jgi:hypothetical protein
VEHHPVAAVVLGALAHFHVTNIPKPPTLVLAYAAHRWRQQKRFVRRRWAALQGALDFLAHFDVHVAQDAITYKITSKSTIANSKEMRIITVPINNNGKRRPGSGEIRVSGIAIIIDKSRNKLATNRAVITIFQRRSLIFSPYGAV